MTQRIAIVGGGVSGLVVAYLLHPNFDVTLFEAASKLGGHVHTVPVEVAGRQWHIDTGFIVYNEKNYPEFTRLLKRIEVDTQPSSMSFSVRSDDPHLEYNGSSLSQLFAQRSNLVRPSFYRMLLDILRFNRAALRGLQSNPSTLGDLISESGYSDEFARYYLIPLASALWSTPPGSVLDMPARFVVRFLDNHGMLSVNERPEWRVIKGGSSTYVDALTRSFNERIMLNSPAKRVTRLPDSIQVNDMTFDHVVFACHSDEALSTLTDASAAEHEILGAFRYQDNDIVLHTDTSVLPRRRRAWGAWNYHTKGGASSVAITYNMNILQTLDAPEQFCVTLNSDRDIDQSKVLYRTRFSHPQYTAASSLAAERFSEISGVRRTHYCGAYWGHGFHEDGVVSALRICEAFGVRA